MATKTSRRSSSMSTTQSTSFGSSMRSPSPSRISRLQEKEELGGLNDRLANYIDKVRSLETENSRLLVQIKSFEETSTREVNNIKKLYDQELKDARRILDDLGKDKAKLQIDVQRLEKENDALKARVSKQDRDIASLEKKLASAESELASLKARLTDANQARQNAENENKKLRTELAATTKQLDECRSQLESETLMRVDWHNKYQTAKEELIFKSQIHEQELNETKSRTEVTMTEVDDHFQQEYDNRLAEALKEMRSQHEYQATIYREEIETMCEKKLSEIRVMAERNLTKATSSQEELKTTRRRLDELGQQVTKLTSENDMLRKRVKELENQLLHEQEDHQKTSEMYQEQIKELQQSLADTMREYSDLLDIKIALDMEITAYRKLLEGEEERLNLSSQSESSMSKTPGRRTPARATPTRPGKRKRVSYEGLQSSSTDTSKYATKKSTKTGIEFVEADEDGRYIKLQNTSDKEQAINGWQIKHVADDMETVWKLPRSAHLKSQQTCTVWSSDSEATHNPPSDYVMKGQRWFTADSMQTVLLNSKGEEVADLDMTRSMLRTFQTGHSSDFGGEGDPRQKEKCAIM